MREKIKIIKDILQSKRASFLERSDGCYLNDAFAGCFGEANKIKVEEVVMEIERLEKERDYWQEEYKKRMKNSIAIFSERQFERD